MALSGSSFDTTLVNNSPAQFGGTLSPNLSVVATSDWTERTNASARIVARLWPTA